MSELEQSIGGDPEPYRRILLIWAELWIALSAGQLDTAQAQATELGSVMTETVTWSAGIGAHAALWARDPAGVRALLATLDANGKRGRAIEMDRHAMQAGIAALEDRRGDALAGYRTALAEARDLGLAWDEALIAIDMVEALGARERDARVAGTAAREILVGLRATPFIERLDKAFESSMPEAGTPSGMEQAVALKP
jgi:hypothetical protein